jgi:hypothetical protein
MKVGVYGDHTIHRCREQPADRPLADRFAFVEGSVLAHVTEIRCQQDEPACAGASQRFRGEQNGEDFVIRLVKRSIDDRGRCRLADRHTHFPVWKTMHRDFLQGKAKSKGQPFCIVCTGWQALNGDLVHDVVLP